MMKNRKGTQSIQDDPGIDIRLVLDQDSQAGQSGQPGWVGGQTEAARLDQEVQAVRPGSRQARNGPLPSRPVPARAPYHPSQAVWPVREVTHQKRVPLFT